MSELSVVEDVILDIAAHSAELDRGGAHARRSFETLGAVGLLGLGTPNNHDGRLPEMVALVQQLSGECLSTGFAVWAHRMTIEYLAASGGEYGRSVLPQLLDGTRLGVTGMAAAFKYAAAGGELNLTAEVTASGLRVSGFIGWATNLHPDSILVTAVATADGQLRVVALPLTASGITIGKPHELMALDSTASASVRLVDVDVPHEQVFAAELSPFLDAVRPSFLLLQSALCLGLARRCLERAGQSLHGFNGIFEPEVAQSLAELEDAEARIARFAAAVGASGAADRVQLLTLRLDAARLATTAAGLESRTAGGSGYTVSSTANRRFREASFIPLQSPTEAQLRWELAKSQRA
jgi:alkylation response protein AidB-like acyl-CoA dehydrogenase